MGSDHGPPIILTDLEFEVYIISACVPYTFGLDTSWLEINFRDVCRGLFMSWEFGV